MTQDQIALFGLFAVLIAALVWGRWRHDIVAFAALLAAVLLGLVPARDAFAGFAHSAVVTVALIDHVLSAAGLYDHIDWPVIVLLAALIPLVLATETTGAADLVAGWLAGAAEGRSPWSRYRFCWWSGHPDAAFRLSARAPPR